MDDIVIPMKHIKEYGLSINEYLVLYDIVNEHIISDMLDHPFSCLMSLEKKGFIKLFDSHIYLRYKASLLFNSNVDYFELWLNEYPNRVKTDGGRFRALSPSSVNTILGKKLKNKWKLIFRKNVEDQKKAIEVLIGYVKQMEKDGSSQYMVEAARWLNEGFHEKYSFLADDSLDDKSIDYTNEDYL